MIKVAIIDDEYYARESLKDLINKMSSFDIVGCYESVEKFLKSDAKKITDVLFLDIEMPDMNGLKASKCLENYKIVFVTAYSEYAVDAFEVRALDYLTKPISEIRFIETINRIEEAFRNTKLNKITAKNNDEIIFLDLFDVYYFEYFEKKIRVITQNDEYVLKHFKNLSNWEKELPDYFLRVHKSYIINLNYIDRYINDLNSIQMKNNKIIPIGKTHMKNLKIKLNI